MSRPFFSICIPNYNYEKYVGETIRSVLDQDCQDFEIIVSDNASTDGSVALVERLARESGKIRLVRNRRNIGFAPNLERAARPASGQFMLMLSSDDLMFPGALTAYKKVLDHRGAEAERTVVASMITFIEGSQHTDKTLSPSRSYPFRRTAALPDDVPCRAMGGKELLSLSLREVSNSLPFCSTMYPRALYEAVEGYNGTWTVSPDFHFELKLLAEDPLVVFIDLPLFGYRVHPDNQSAQVQGLDAPLRQEFDTYQLCVDYNEKVVAPLGVDHGRMVRRMVEHFYLREGAKYVLRSDRVRAFRLLMLSWALYPRQTARTPMSWGLGALLALGPAGPPIGRALARLVGPERTS
jgi:glycosyltransferase involved in cell wall biosynthesis